MGLTTLQGKGILLAGLIVYAENIGISNAVSAWPQFQQHPSPSNNSHNNGPRKGISRQASGIIDQTQTCSNGCDAPSSMKQELQKLPRSNSPRLSKRKHQTKNFPVDYCCHECTKCMDSQQVQTMCDLFDIRGGDALGANPVIDAAPQNISLNAWKIFFQFILTTLNVVCWLGPLKNKQFTENKLGLSLANAFSGGVFLSLAFGHFLPECVHGFHGYNEALPFMITLGGYLLIFFVEKVAFDTHSILEGDSCSNSKSTSVTSGKDSSPSLANGRGAIILLGALAVHSILEMTALGLADSFSDAGILTFSIALHQPAESIALLVAFLKSGLSESEIIKYLSIFSLMGPVGVAIGMAVKEFANPVVDSIVLAAVAGTFIYVGATEVIPEEWEESEHKWSKFFCLIGGIVSVFGITQYSMSLENHEL